MKTVKDYLDLGLVFVDGDKGYKHIIESFAWRNNDGVKPKYNGAMEVELNSGDVIFNCGKTSEFDWRINDDVNPKILRWKPIVISDGIAGCGYRFAINECQKTSFLQYKPKINLIVPDSLKAEVRRVGSEVNVTISQKDKQENAVNNLEQVIGIDEVCDAIKQVSPKEDKPMKPVYTAEMHARNELPPVGVECSLKSGSLTQWFNGVCVGYDEEFAVFKMCDDYPFGGRYAGFCHSRIKPIIKTIKVNGFDVPAPMSEAPMFNSVYFTPQTGYEVFYCKNSWRGDKFDSRFLSRGLVHSTESAAIAHAKAMLGIDPNA